MMRNSKEELILGENDYVKVRPLIFDDNGKYALPVQISSPSGCFGPLYVQGDRETLDILEELVKS